MGLWRSSAGCSGTLTLLVMRLKRSEQTGPSAKIFSMSLGVSSLVAIIVAQVSVLILMGLVVRGIPFKSAVILATAAGVMTAFITPLFTFKGFGPTKSLRFAPRGALTVVTGLSALAVQLFVLGGVGLAACGPKGTSDAANLNGIGKGLALYHEQVGEFPTDLRQLVDTGLLDPKALVPVRSDWDDVPPGVDFPYTGPCGWYYATLKPGAPPETLRAWRMPLGPGDDYLYVLQSSGKIPSVTPTEFASRLRESQPFFDGPVNGPSATSIVVPAPTPAPAPVVAARPVD